MANTISSDLGPGIVTATALNTVNAKLAPLTAFTSDFSTDEIRPLSVVNVPVVSSVEATQENPTSFNTTTTVIGDAKVTVYHLSNSFGLTNTQLQQGHRIEQQVEKAASALSTNILQRVFALVTTGNYGAADLTTGSSAFTTDTLNTLWGAVGGGYKAAILADAYYAQVGNPTQTTDLVGKSRFGFDYFDHVGPSVFDSGAANLEGVVCAKEAIVCAAGLPNVHDSIKDQMWSYEVVETEVGLPLAVSMWSDVNSRSVYGNLSVMFGCQTGDTSALAFVKSA
jgi:hypothetical protein